MVRTKDCLLIPSLHVLPQDSTTNLLDSNNDDYETAEKATVLYMHLHKFVMDAARGLQRHQLLSELIERQSLRAGLSPDVVAVAHVDGSAVQLLLADHCGA